MAYTMQDAEQFRRGRATYGDEAMLRELAQQDPDSRWMLLEGMSKYGAKAMLDELEQQAFGPVRRDQAFVEYAAPEAGVMPESDRKRIIEQATERRKTRQEARWQEEVSQIREKESQRTISEFRAKTEQEQAALMELPPEQRLKQMGYTPEEIERTMPAIRGEVVPPVPEKPMPAHVQIIPKAREIPAREYDPVAGMKVFAEGMWRLRRQPAAKLVMALQGHKGASVVDPGRADRLVIEATKDADKFARKTAKLYKDKMLFPGISIQDVAQLPANLAYSGVSMATGFAVGVPISMIPVPIVAQVTGATSGAVAAGTVAYKMASYEIMQTFLETANDYSKEVRGRTLTKKEEDKLKKDFASNARKYGLWEAIPEAIGSGAGIAIAAAPLRGAMTAMRVPASVQNSMIARTAAKVGAMYAEELATETVTQMGQERLLAEAGLPGGKEVDWASPNDWFSALRTVAPQTFLLTTLLGGMGAAAVEANAAVSEVAVNRQVKKILDQLEQDLGAESPEFDSYADKIIETAEQVAPKRKEVNPRDVKPYEDLRNLGYTPTQIRQLAPDAANMIAVQGIHAPQVEITPQGWYRRKAVTEMVEEKPIERLRGLGWNYEQIKRMSPATAREVVGKKVNAAGLSVDLQGNVVEYEPLQPIREAPTGMPGTPLERPIEVTVPEERIVPSREGVGEIVPGERPVPPPKPTVPVTVPEKPIVPERGPVTEIVPGELPAFMHPIPEKAAGVPALETKGVPEDVKQLAVQRAKEANEELDGARVLYRRIMDRGGLKPYESGRELEEFKTAAPAKYRRKAGLPPDEMASELGMGTDQELYAAIQKIQRLDDYVRRKLPKGKKQFSGKDFLEEAKAELEGISEESVRDIVAAMDDMSRRTIAGYTDGNDILVGLARDVVETVTGTTENIDALVERYGEDQVAEMLKYEAEQQQVAKPMPVPPAPAELPVLASATIESGPAGALRLEFEPSGIRLDTEQLHDEIANIFPEHNFSVEERRSEIRPQNQRFYVQFRQADGSHIPPPEGAYQRLGISGRFSFGELAVPYEPVVPPAGEEGPPPGELFKLPPGELSLEMQDLATSEDQLEIYLQRKGWDLGRVKELQESISRKATPDMFTGETEPLTAGEVELQRDIQEFIDSQKRPEAPPTTPTEPIPEVKNADALKALGFSEAQIRRINPESAQEIQEKNVPAERVSVTQDGSFEVFDPVRPETPNLDDARRANMEAYKARKKAKGEDIPPAGMSVRTVNVGLPVGSKEDKAMKQAHDEIIGADPELNAALSDGNKVLAQARGLKERFRNFIDDVSTLWNPEADKRLKRTQPQYADDKRTGLRPIPYRALMDATKDIGALWGDLTKRQREIVLNMVFMRSFIQSGGEGIEIPHSLTLDQVLTAYRKAENNLRQRAPELLDVIDRNDSLMTGVGNELVNRALLKPGDLKTLYAPHVVVKYNPASFLEGRIRYRKLRKPFMPYTKKRKGSPEDIYANEDAIVARLAQMYADIRFHDWAMHIYEKNDILPTLSEAQRVQLFGRDAAGRIRGPKPSKPYEIGGKMYRGGQYVPGNMIYNATAVDESLLAEAFMDAMEEIALADPTVQQDMIYDIASRGMDAIEQYLIGIGPRGGNALRTVRAIGQYNRVYLLPEDIWFDTRNLVGDPYRDVRRIMRDLNFLTNRWKAVTTQVAGGVPFHFRNAFGDWRNMERTALRSSRWLPTAWKILRGIEDPSTLTPFEQQVLQIALGKDVLGAGFLHIMNRIGIHRMNIPVAKEMATMWHYVQKFSNFREGLCRIAMVCDQLHKHQQGKPLAKMYSKEIQGLDPESAIGLISRRFAVDYLDVPDWYSHFVSGFFFPFATFFQKNFINWKLYATRTPGKFAARYLAPRAAVYAWNHTGDRADVEDKLPWPMRTSFHLTAREWDDTGNGEPNRALIFAPETPFDLAAEVVGMDRVLENAELARRGVISAKEAAYDSAVEIGKGAPRLAEQLMNPLLRFIYDYARNYSPYTGKIVPDAERGLRDYQKIRRYYLTHFLRTVITPLGAFLQNIEDGHPIFYGIPGTRTNAQGLMHGAGFYIVDLDRQVIRQYHEIAENIEARYESWMRKIEDEYVKRGNTDIDGLLRDPKIQMLMQDAWRDNFPVKLGGQSFSETITVEAIKERLNSPRVGRRFVDELLKTEGLSEESKKKYRKAQIRMDIKALEDRLDNAPKSMKPVLKKKLASLKKEAAK